jgi:hypothetical protein
VELIGSKAGMAGFPSQRLMHSAENSEARREAFADRWKMI